MAICSLCMHVSIWKFPYLKSVHYLSIYDTLFISEFIIYLSKTCSYLLYLVTISFKFIQFFLFFILGRFYFTLKQLS